MGRAGQPVEVRAVLKYFKCPDIDVLEVEAHCRHTGYHPYSMHLGLSPPSPTNTGCACFRVPRVSRVELRDRHHDSRGWGALRTYYDCVPVHVNLV